MKRRGSGCASDLLDPVLDFFRLLWSIEYSLQRTRTALEPVGR